MKTLQEIFDTAYLGLARQGFEASLNSDSGCAYRGQGGLKCAIGHCIPDKAYKKNLEGLRAGADVVLKAAGIPLRLEDAAEELQIAHDNAVNPADMHRRLTAFASIYGLTIPQIGGAV